MEKNIYCGRGTHVDYTTYMDLINLVFGFKTPETQFLGLLPKLYREERRPQDSNYVVIEDGVLCAAVGAFDHELTVCGETLPCRGIGNVAVHPDYRSRGYMKMTMEAAIDDMVKDGIALSSLGGRRQRYQYFSYDKAGLAYNFYFNRDNLKHVWRDMTAPFDGFCIIESNDHPLLDGIKALSDAGVVSPVRSRKDFLDICNSWKCKLMAITHEGALKGYAIVDDHGGISEIRAVKTEEFLDVLRSLLVHTERGHLSVSLPSFETDYVTALDPVSEGVHESCSMMYTVLDYRRVINAFLQLKTEYTNLPDGKIALLIHGRGGDERLSIEITAGTPSGSIISDDEPVDLELSHLQAMNLLFAPVSPKRETLPELFRLWFPLPLWVYRADEV